jgi:ParB family chromosome partitioning protein
VAAAKKKGLGRGLEALLGLDSGPGNDGESSTELRQIAIAAIQPGRYQPRTGMDPRRLQELADSIRAQGLIQPITVRPAGRGRFEIIAGERRWRAAELAGLSEVPCVVREVDDHATLAIALIENIQREDLSPLEEAGALKRLIEEFKLTHQQAAEAVGRSRVAVTNLLRLLELPDSIKRLMESHQLEMGHARALLTLPAKAAEALAGEAARAGWSVRELEQRVRRLGESAAKPGAKARAARRGAGASDPNVRQLEQQLAEKLGAKVSIQHGQSGRGKLVIEYFSLDELDGILERIK